MPVSKTAVDGRIYLPNITKPQNAQIIFELSSWDKEEGEGIFVTGPYVSDIGENGDFSVELFTTTSGENQTVYNVTITYLTELGFYKRECLGTVALHGTGPYSLSDLDFIDPSTTSSFDLLAEVRARTLESNSKFEDTQSIKEDAIAAKDATIEFLNLTVEAKDVSFTYRNEAEEFRDQAQELSNTFIGSILTNPINTFTGHVEFSNDDTKVFLLNNRALCFSVSGGVDALNTSTNIDHIWHDDNNSGIYGDCYHFVKDSTYKDIGNSNIKGATAFVDRMECTGTITATYGYIDGLVDIARDSDEQLRLGRTKDENPYLSFHNGTTRCGFVQGHWTANELRLGPDRGGATLHLRTDNRLLYDGQDVCRVHNSASSDHIRIGTHVSVARRGQSQPQLGETVVVRLDADSRFFSMDPSRPALTGLWRSRGMCVSDDWFIVQKVAD